MANNISLQKLKGDFSLRPRAEGSGETVIVYPFKRSVGGAIFMLIFLVIFCFPYFDIGGFEDSDDTSLFDLVFNLFNVFFLMGWSVGVLMLLTIFLGMVFGQERITMGVGRLKIRLEILGVGIARSFDGDRISHLRLFEPAVNGSTAWRGPHITFKYDDEIVAFGSNLNEHTAEALIQRLEKSTLGQKPPDDIRSGKSRRATGRQRQSSRSRHAPDELTLGSSSVIALIAANILPIGGVLFFDWSVGHIMLLYWAESAIIGAFNIARMWKIEPTATLVMGPFFLGHYGGFMVGHLLFIYALMLDGADASINEVLADFTLLLPAFIALTISHGVSYVTNFLAREEYLDVKVSQQMMAPYKRITVMHLTLIFGGFLAMALSSPLPAMLLMIVLKTVADVHAHLREHRDAEG